MDRFPLVPPTGITWQGHAVQELVADILLHLPRGSHLTDIWVAATLPYLRQFVRIMCLLSLLQGALPDHQ